MGSADVGSDVADGVAAPTVPEGAPPATRRLDLFSGAGYDKGRNLLWQAAWFAVSHLVFQPWWLPARLRPVVLRAFGARVGVGSNIRNGVRVHWPWKLTVGDHVWIGEGAWLLNLEPITIGDHCCVSQEAVLCTGGHAADSPSFEFDNAPIVLEDGVWVALRAIVLRGVTVPRGAVAPAGVVIRQGGDAVPGRDLVPAADRGTSITDVRRSNGQ